MTRSTRTNARRLLTFVDYPWSLDYRNIDEATVFLTHVKDGITEVASQLRLSIPPNNIAWLDETEGDYKFYIHPDSDEGKRLLQTQKHRHMSLEDLSAHLEVTRHAILAPSPRFTSSSLSPNTMTNYERFCMQLWWFLAFIGDYHSMLLLLSEIPRNVPSMDVTSIKSFLQHKYLPRHTPLCKDDNPLTPVLDLNGNQILSEGTVKNHVWLNSAFAAFQHLHLIHHQNGSYVLCCPTCRSNFQQEIASACPHHPTQRYCHRGNPISSHILKRFKKWLEDESHRRNYKVLKRQSLLPSDLVDMHMLVSSTQFQLKHLQMFTMLLDALDTAMRKDGYTSVQFNHFEDYSDLWKCDRVHGIKHLAQGVKEKTDKDVQVYKIMFKDETPKLCFLRHLLVYVHCTSHGQGHLFPETVHLVDEEVINPPNFDEDGDPIPTFPVTYMSVRYWINTRLSTNCRHGHIGSFGPHTLRRSFYLFWTLAGGVFESVMKHARHRDLTTAQAYKEDTDVLVEDIQGNPQLARIQPAWKWHHRLLANDGQNLRRLQAFDPTDIRLHTLQEASTFFVEQQLGVPSSSADYRNPGPLLDLAYAREFSKRQDPIQECLHLLQKLPTTFREPLTTQFHRALEHLTNTIAMGTTNTTSSAGMLPTGDSHTLDQATSLLLENNIAATTAGPVLLTPEVNNADTAGPPLSPIQDDIRAVGVVLFQGDRLNQEDTASSDDGHPSICDTPGRLLDFVPMSSTPIMAEGVIGNIAHTLNFQDNQVHVRRGQHAINFQDLFMAHLPELGGLRPPLPGQHVVLEVDVQENRKTSRVRHPYYKLKACYAKELQTTFGLRPIKILVRLCHEIICLSPPLLEGDNLRRFTKGSSRVRASRHIFPKYMNRFSKCFHICYSQDVERLVLDHPHFSPKDFVGCHQCLNSTT